VIAVACFVSQGYAQSGIWVPLTNQPTFNASTAYVLTDGRVLSNDVSSVHWWLLTPDAAGSYQNGTWSQAADSNDDRLYFASGVFADGRVILSGGEYSSSGGSETNHTEIYNPVTNVWTAIAPPPGWNNVGDAPSIITADGRFLLCNIFDTRTAFYDPVSGLWTAGPQKFNASSEATLILLQDGTALTWDCIGHPSSEKWVPSINSWVTCGNVSVDLVLPGSIETGAAILRPNGNTFCIGGTPFTANYTPPPNPINPGTWTNGPPTPIINGRMIGAEDAPAAILPNANVLMALGPVTANGGTYEAPTYFFEYDGTNLTQVSVPPTSNGPPFIGRMLVLPTGEVMWLTGSHQVYLYSNLPSASAAWKPTLQGYSKYMERNISYTLKGLQFNGVSNGASYGDECYVATNYPLVRLNEILTNRTYYCRTFGHSTMGVQTGNTGVSTHVIVPSSVPAGKKTMRVVANGIPSDPADVIIVDTTNVASFGIDQGTYVSGGLSELKASDDTYLVVNANGQGVVQVTLKGILPTTAVGTLGANYECGVNTGGVSQKLEFLNWQTNTWEVIDSRSATTTDQSVTPIAGGNVARFISSNAEVAARITFTTFSIALFQARIDRHVWVSSP
jgi:hypothetical protein